MLVVLNNVHCGHPLGQAAYSAQQTAVGDLQWSTTKYCLQAHLLEKLDPKPVAVSLMLIQQQQKCREELHATP